MQGRLLPFFKCQYQAHPVSSWKKEFKLAKENNLKYIEFIIDSYLYGFNPIFNENGLREIKELSKKNGIKVKSICADIFMQWPLKIIDSKEVSIYGSILEKLICNLAQLGGTDIVIPFVDKSSIKNKKEKLFISSFLSDFDKLCTKMDINLSLETDLEPEEFLDFILMINNKKITVNYDSGNSASLGFDFEKEIKLYGEKISNIHIKDRKYQGGPVLLGEGNAQLKEVKNFIVSKNYNGIVVFQAFRDKTPIKTFKKQFEYFLNL
tara:strand:+ start:5177 stop:5971 length:795 start_codon:yes stop_codon:yes gene_type:complete